jgi:sugar phosphate isomerase/epimerase
VKLYYSTYGMKQLDIFTALPRLKEMGYEGMEIAVTPGWPTEPALMDSAARRKLADLLRELDFPTPALMALLSPCVEGESRPAALAQFRATFELSRELRLDDHPMVIGTTLGPAPAWEGGKERIAELVVEVADMAAEYDAILAIEPHAGGDFETPEKAAWLMETTNHDHLGLNFDYSHFWVDGIDLQHAIDLNLSYSVHNHIKGGYRDQDGAVHYLLPGDGELDMIGYFRAMREAGWDSYICPEVTGQISNVEGYDAWATAQFCFDALAAARRATGDA